MHCSNCGATLADNVRFCYACGAAVALPPGARPAGGLPPPPPPPPPAAARPPPVAPAGAQSLKCPNCGAPVHPVFGDMVLTCEYCGSSVSLGSDGWRQINKHTMLVAKVVTRDQIIETVRKFVDTGFFHRKTFEESTIADEKLQYVPFWIVPVTATTNYTYTDVAIGVGGTVASIAASEMIGGAVGRRGRFVPVIAAPPVNPTRQDTIVGSYEFPIIAVRSMTALQPKEYQFQLDQRTLFDRKGLPDGVPVLNGDLAEEVAQSAATAHVTRLQTEAAHKRHMMVSQLACDARPAEAELLHAPIYQFSLDRKGTRTSVVVDAHAGQVMRTAAP